MRDLCFEDLYLFTRVADLGSLSAVARERNVSVSQASCALARIEARCGAQLAHRTTHRLRLPPEGLMLLESRSTRVTCTITGSSPPAARRSSTAGRSWWMASAWS